nr:dihydrofolate reductase [uncultured bacterium]
MTGLDGRDRRIVLVAAVADNGVIGDGPNIPWHVPGEQAGFKQLTMGRVLLMGRTTYETIGRPLPGRTTVVLTRDQEWRAAGVLVAHSLDEALALAEDLEGDVMVAGGAEVYAAALPVAHAQVLTEVHLRPGGDVRYPDFDRSEWTETRREQHLDAGTPWERVWLERA